MDDWQHRVDAVWSAADELGDDEVIRRIDALAAERSAGDPIALFERAGARDSAGLEAEAETLYREALDRGLDGSERVQAHIQLASTIRNLGRPTESIALLDAVEADAGDLHDAVVAFRALARVDAGDPRRAASEALLALAAHLPRYRVSLAAYATELGASA
ncbi:tetratricopeptide repeat protein [Agromyces sp. H66]|uniref:tetratricopeptide repeat protein n=1 Tax=Agromyces sp. H66 TaxID=2529859 RepID=UPI0010AA4E67|nr:tetratricopeptide repeat protein [Agromyces sp. H66]